MGVPKGQKGVAVPLANKYFEKNCHFLRKNVILPPLPWKLTEFFFAPLYRIIPRYTLGLSYGESIIYRTYNIYTKVQSKQKKQKYKLGRPNEKQIYKNLLN